MRCWVPGLTGGICMRTAPAAAAVTVLGLAAALAFLQPGDCLVVWKLDRLGRSLPHLLVTVNNLKARGIAFRSLTEQMDTTTPQGEFLFHVFRRMRCEPRRLPNRPSISAGGHVASTPSRIHRNVRLHRSGYDGALSAGRRESRA
jgi:hypothetical protein